MFIVIGIHLLVGLVLYVFDETNSMPPALLQSREKIIYLYVYRHPAATSIISNSEKNSDKYWISGSTLSELTTKIDYSSLIEKGRAIVLLIGLNDAANNEASEEDLHSFVDKLPVSIPIICFAVPPVDNQIETQRNNAKISEYNRKIKKACADKENCNYIDLTGQFADKNGSLKAEYQSGDGMNFNDRGNQFWINAIKSVVP